MVRHRHTFLTLSTLAFQSFVAAKYAVYEVKTADLDSRSDIFKYGPEISQVLVNDEIPNSKLGEKIITSEKLHQMIKNTFKTSENWYESYHNDTEILGYYDQLFEVYNADKTHDSIIKSSLGKSIENRTIFQYILPARTQPAKHNVVLNCAIHAREWIAPASCQYFIEEYLNSTEFQEISNVMDLYLIPIDNVDGYAYTWECQNCTYPDGDEHRLWRKTRNPNTNVDNPENCYGIDLNRNFDAGFGGEGSSGDPCSTTYRGVAAESEIEAKVVADLVRDKNPILFIDLHSYTQKLLFPYGYTLQNATTRPTLEKLGQMACDEMKKVDNVTYVTGSSSDSLYINSGSSKDWAYDAGVPLSYTVRSKMLVRLPQFGHFRGFLSEMFGQKIDFSKLPNKTSPKAIFEKSIFCPKISLQKPQK